MPKELERKLEKEVANKPWSKERKNAYIYGTLRKTGWKPKKHNPEFELTVEKKNIGEDLSEGDTRKIEMTGEVVKENKDNYVLNMTGLKVLDAPKGKEHFDKVYDKFMEKAKQEEE